MVAIDFQGMPPLGGREGFPLLCGFAFLSPPRPLLLFPRAELVSLTGRGNFSVWGYSMQSSDDPFI